MTMGILQELENTLKTLLAAQKELEQIKLEQAAQGRELFELKRQLAEVSILPEWIPTSKVLLILDIKKPHTLKNYANMGLLEFKRGRDKRNYYKRESVMTLPERLFEYQNQTVDHE